MTRFFPTARSVRLLKPVTYRDMYGTELSHWPAGLVVKVQVDHGHYWLGCPGCPDVFKDEGELLEEPVEIDETFIQLSNN